MTRMGTDVGLPMSRSFRLTSHEQNDLSTPIEIEGRANDAANLQEPVTMPRCSGGS